MLFSKPELISQENICDDIPYEEDALQDFGLPQATGLQSPTVIKVYFIVYRDDDGSNGVDIGRLYEIISRLNSGFAQANFSFIWRECETIFINNSELNDRTGFCSFEPTFNDGLNLVIRGDNKAWGAIAKSIPGNLAILGGTCLSNCNNSNLGTIASSSNYVIHEVGHCLGLFHTHHASCSSTEPITRCGSDAVHVPFPQGDFVDDTPLDPILSDKVNQNCEWNKKRCTNPNIQVNPLTNNYMSYTRPVCMNSFTPGQIARMHALCPQNIKYFGPPERPVLTVTDLINVCPSDGYNLNNFVSSATPCSAQLIWSLDGNPEDGVSEIVSGNVNVTGIYYAYYYYPIENAYGPPSTPINFTALRCCFEIPDLIINTNTEITENLEMGKIIVKSGKTLTVKSELNFGQNTSIIVEVGGKVILDGGKLTKCSGVNKWQGIKAWGNPFFGQSHAVELKNGAVIEYAETGISTSNPVYGGIFGYFDLSGAKVTVENATIRNCDVGIKFGPYGYAGGLFSWEDDSYIHNSTFKNCLTGVKLISNLGVEITATDFSGNDTYYGIESTNSKIEVKNCSFEGTTGIIADATWPSLEGSKIENNFFYSQDGVIIETQGNALPHTISRNYFNSNNGILATGQSWFEIRNNDFIGNQVGTYNFYAGDDFNITRDNYFIGDKYGNSVFGINSTEYLNNCFSLSEQADIELYHESSVFITQGTPELAAGNCFTRNGVPQILTGTDTEPFEYYLKINTIPQSCKNPGSGNFNIELSNDEINLGCGTGYWVNIPVNYRLCIIPGSLSEKRAMESALRDEINRVKNNPNITPRLKQLLIADYQRCLKKLVNMHGIQIIKEENNGREKAIEYFSEQSLFSHQIMAYALMMENNEMQRANNYLNSLVTNDNAQVDFVQVQNIYHDYLQNPESFYLSPSTRQSVRSKALESNELSGYIRSIYHILTGERLRIEMEHLLSATPRIKEPGKENSEFKIHTYPNPASADEYYVHIPVAWGDQECRIRIRDMKGKLFASSMGYPGINTVDVKNLDSGVYILEIYSHQDRLYTGRFVRI